MKYNLALIFSIIFSFCCFSQQEEINGDKFQILNSDNEVFSLLSSINLSQLSTTENLVSNNQNEILIQQIGDFNSVIAQTQATSSNLELIQFGNSNEIELLINAPSINGSVLQNGNNNSVIDNIYYTNQNVELNVIQNGNNLTLNRIGANSLTNKINLVQQGSFKTITIISK